MGLIKDCLQILLPVPKLVTQEKENGQELR